jgi:hypothetical protein
MASRFRARLEEEIKEYFPDIDEMKELCFEKKEEEEI